VDIHGNIHGYIHGPYTYTCLIGVGARGLGGCSLPQTLAKAKFFGQKPAAKNEKKYFFVVIKRKKRIHSV